MFKGCMYFIFGLWSLLEKAMAPHFSNLTWKIPWMEEPGGLQSMGSLSVGNDWATSLSLFTFHFHALEKEMATHSSVLAWRIPGTGEPGGLPSMGSHRVGHDWNDLAAVSLTPQKIQWGLLYCPGSLTSEYTKEGEVYFVYQSIQSRERIPEIWAPTRMWHRSRESVIGHCLIHQIHPVPEVHQEQVLRSWAGKVK